MESLEQPTIDSLLENLGGCGIFQILIVTATYGSVVTVAWSMMFMAYGAYNPGWTCANFTGHGSNHSSVYREPFASNVSWSSEKAVTNFSTSCEGYSSCGDVRYNDDASTVVTEWNLACDKTYIISSIIIIQMGGVLVGTSLGVQLCNYLGRKPTHYLTLAAHSMLNFLITFSANWKLFASTRFLIGITCDILLVSGYLYAIEFIARKWRSVVGAIPFWNTGNLICAATAMFMRDWKYVHICNAVLTAILILPVIWAPESMRWLAVNAKVKKAHSVAEKVGKMNRTEAPNLEVIDQIAEEEKKRKDGEPTINIQSLYKRDFIKRTFVVSLMWLCFTLLYYGIMYGVRALSGDFYVNLMLTSVITTVMSPFIPLLSNNFGRKYGCLLLMTLAAIGCLILVCFHFTSTNIDKGLAVLITTLLVLIFIDGAFVIVFLYTVELYPTMLRSLGLSHANCVARIGGMIAPFLIPIDESTAYISHIVMTVLILLSCMATLLLPETNRKQMADSMKSRHNPIQRCDIIDAGASNVDELENLA